MALANIFVGLHRAKFASPQLRAYCANRFTSRCVPGESNKQTIRELVARFIAVDVRHDHFECARLIKFFDEFRGGALAFESSKRAINQS